MLTSVANLLRQASTISLATFAAVASIAAGPQNAGDVFARGDFNGAKSAYLNEVAQHPGDADAAYGLARIELYENHLDAAATFATKILRANPNDENAKRLLQTVDQRRAVIASAMSLDVPDGGVVLPFLESEPLPAIRMLVNGKAGTFIIDTGGADVTLDPEFATECGLAIQGGSLGRFLGGKTAKVREAVAGRIDAGSIALKEAKVSVLPSRGMHLFKDRMIDGVVGTVFLSRFLSTIDYPRHRLVLRPRTVAWSEAAKATIPMWLVGDHFIFALGSVNGLQRRLFSIDTGGAGVGFMPDEATVAAAHVKTFDDKAFEAMGGGGPVRVIPSLADQVCLGTVRQNEVHGGYTPGDSPLKIFPFMASGTVSHEFLKKYAVTFDFVRMRIELSASV